MFHPAELFTSVFSAGKSPLWRAATAFVSPWPPVIMCYLIRRCLVWPHDQGHWPASVRPYYRASPFLCLSVSSSTPPSPLPVLPMNVSISLPMCKLFSPAPRADGEQCLCRDFLCMSFLISRRVTRFQPLLCQKRSERASERAAVHTYTHCTNMRLATRHQYARRVTEEVGWGGYWHSESGDWVHYVSSPYWDRDGLIQQRGPGLPPTSPLTISVQIEG